MEYRAKVINRALTCGGGVVELEGDWHGIRHLHFWLPAVVGPVEKGDQVILTIRGGRLAPVINTIQRA